MPTPSHSALTSDNSITDGTSFVSASVSPTANRLVYVAFLSTAFDQVDRVPPNSVAGAGLTFDLHCMVQLDAFNLLTLWRAMSASPGTGAVTIGLPNTQDAAAWAIGEWADVLTTGVNGADALSPPKPASRPAVGTTAVILDPLEVVTNPLNSMMAINAWSDINTGTNATATPGGSYTESVEVGAQEVGFGCVLQIQTLQGIAPSPVSWNIADALGSILVEVRGELPQAAYGTQRVAVNRRSQGANRSRGIAEALDARAWL